MGVEPVVGPGWEEVTFQKAHGVGGDRLVTAVDGLGELVDLVEVDGRGTAEADVVVLIFEEAGDVAVEPPQCTAERGVRVAIVVVGPE